ncbi:NfeD family protein [Marinitenerispora sediminis]|uniref:NfeD-like C-terminal domain-containing protein n=1 Tax=Marinitenerispora sediminis TaxID=1931232 RepID=A0A368SYU2_9ACTN|nr:NfeD family protein [Marinitenerispora sediminis]RCV49827.1 hypothetical protein DEF24_24845 [Marinitenerispora sediminis]RCV54653.1 hypothetical protein DEF23_15585 [Marinitenerispora sediminis]RCV56411.1 hypothetical protein DEF28_03660 [Marinitenerispora sediminis]
MPVWILWMIAAVVLGVAEIFTLTLSLGLLAVAAMAAGVAGALGGNLVLQALAFVLTSATGLLVVRPVARRHLRQPPPLRSGTAALVGRSAVVIEEIAGERGRIRLSGEEWTARSFDENQVIPAGARVDVLEIQGATAVVYPHESLP